MTTSVCCFFNLVKFLSCSSWLSRSQRRPTAYLSTKFRNCSSLFLFFGFDLRFVNACIFLFFFRCASFWLRNYNNAFLHWFYSFVKSVTIIFSSLRSCYVYFTGCAQCTQLLERNSNASALQEIHFHTDGKFIDSPFLQYDQQCERARVHIP